jgi:hypothetical protein
MIVIWWGNNVYKRPAGVATDYCVVCHDVRPLRLVDISTSEHVMSVSVSPEQYIGRVRACDACGAEWLFAPRPDVPMPRDLDASQRAQIMRQRGLLEERARARQLSEPERTALLREPFQLLNAAVASRGKTKMDGTTRIFVAVTFLVPLLVGIGSCATKGDPKNWGDAGLLGVFAAPIVLALITAVVASAEPKRFARNHIVAKLAPALRPLNPSPLELRRVLDDLRAQRFAIAEHVRASDVMRAL